MSVNLAFRRVMAPRHHPLDHPITSSLIGPLSLAGYC